MASKVNHIETLDFVADERWVHDVSIASYGEVLGKWALYHTLLDDGLLPEETRGRARGIFARLDFERRYRDGEFSNTEAEALSGPSKHDMPSQIFRAMSTLYVHSCDAFAARDLQMLLRAWGDVRNDDKYELSDNQQLAVEAIIGEINQNLRKRSATMNLKEG